MFVDRTEPMEELRSLVLGLAEGRGSALLVEGASGMGKTSLLSEFVRRTSASAPRARSCRVITARCHPCIGPGVLYGPIIDILVKLDAQTGRSRFKQLLGTAGRSAARSLPDLLSALVPGLGQVLKMGRDVTEAALSSGSMPFDSLLPFQQSVAIQIVDAVLKLTESGPPTVLTIDDVQNIDSSSLLVLDRLLRMLPGSSLALVLSHATGETLDGAAESTRELLRLWESEGLVRSHSLSGLPDDAIAELVRHHCPTAPPALPTHLSTLTAGHPIFVRLCLDEWQPEHGDRILLPQSVERVVKDRMRRLPPDDQLLLVTAATQGPTFLSRTVATAMDLPDEETMERLRRIAEDHQLITRGQRPDWASHDPSDCYRFQHLALWNVLYHSQQTDQQRRIRHARIARALAEQSGLASARLERRLEIARHLEEGGLECLAESATAHYALARSAAIDGLSFAEAERHCWKAIRTARKLPDGAPGRDRQLAEAIELLLSLTEVRWRGESAGGPLIDALAAEAEQAASRCAAPELVARTTLLRGKTLMATKGLVPGLGKLSDAVKIAEQQDDPVALFVAKVEYGRQVSKRNLTDGLAQLQQAEELYASDPRLGASGDPVLQHARNLNEMQLGITLFDDGRPEQALTRLARCTDRLRLEPLNVELPIALNYLAQVHTGLGRFDEAERILHEARSTEAERGGDSGWHAYNTALLAQLLTSDPRRRGECLTLIEEAWLETERTWLINLVPIVRNLYAQVVLDTADNNPHALETVHRLATDTVVETRRTGMVRSEIAAMGLSTQVHLLQGDLAAAVAYARDAVRLLEQTGDMPALRSEEILFHAARTLRAAGSEAEARDLLGRARIKVAQKGATITDPALRNSFLTNVPLNRAIMLSDPESE
ncbi:AAA family ATPase [Streptomyces sp. SID10853]|uniref:ATP-binding protein n=1 Tax=Streptomyces sp. SID10853 TaxID=2706028 RepID=UPI0013BF65E9|nr:tetratricopeptide repeat protein [Streptomyces sp. SID10853]NDZ78971.1 AAA family ATPase [Streptomyces sp. SID10853]